MHAKIGNKNTESYNIWYGIKYSSYNPIGTLKNDAYEVSFSS